MEQISVTVSRIRYPNEDKEREKRNAGEKNIFYLLECVCNGLNILAKGELPGRPQVNERLKLNGNYVVWQGQRQFAWKNAEIDLPVNQRDMLRYACELTSGFGPSMEQKIWDAKGEDWRDVSSDDGIKGLTDAKIAALRATIERLTYRQQEAKTIAWLMSLGCTLNMANAAWELWGVQTQTQINADCYVLCELPNYGFSDADKLRAHFGIGDDDERRLKAAVRYCMTILTEGGNNVVPWFVLSEQLAAKLPGVAASTIANTVGSMMESGELMGWPDKQLIAFQKDFDDDFCVYEYVCHNQIKKEKDDEQQVRVD